MLLKINGPKSYFWQWDLDRQLVVGEDSCGEVHFCNGTTECALVCEIYQQDGLRLVNVPNILLQADRELTAYLCTGDGTRHQQTFQVVARNKPDDYVYTETEVKTWGALEERVKALEESSGGEISQQVQADYAQNDSTAADYVKNRTHYEETVEEYVCFEAYMEYQKIQTVATKYEVPDGAECTVYVDGVVYGNNPAKVYSGGYVMISPDMSAKFDNSAHTFWVSNYWAAGTVKIVVNNLSVVKQLDEKYIPVTIARAEDIPEVPEIPATLPNPNKLTFCGAADAEYDGSEAVEVVIPQGGGEVWELIFNTTLAEDLSSYTITADMSGSPFSLKKASIFMRIRGNTSGSTGWINLLVSGEAGYRFTHLPSGFAAVEGQDYYITSKTIVEVNEFEVAVVSYKSQNNGSSKDNLMNFSGAGTSLISGERPLSAITKIQLLASGNALGANTEIMIYGVRS